MKRRMNPNSLKNIEAYKIKPGQVLNPSGKKAGTIDKATRIRNAILDGFDINEFKKWKADEKTEFMRILVKIMPQELNINAGISVSHDDPAVIDQKVKAAMLRLGYTEKKG